MKRGIGILVLLRTSPANGTGGNAMRDDIAEVVDPMVHVVAKTRKDAVAQLK